METSWCALCGVPTNLGCPCCVRAFCSVECQSEWHGVEFIGAPVHKRKHSDTTTTTTATVDVDDDGITDDNDDTDDDENNDNNDSEVSDEDSTMEVAMPEFEDAPALDGGYVFGTPEPDEKPFFKIHEGNHKIPFRRASDGKFVLLPVHAKIGYYKRATIPNSLFKERPPDGFEAQIDFDGKHVRWRILPNEKWRESKPRKIRIDGYRSFTIRRQGFLASNLVCSAYYGPKPTKLETTAQYDAGHAVPVAPGIEPHDAASEVNWITHIQNIADKKIAGTANVPLKGKQQAIFARRFVAGNPEDEKAYWNNLGIASEHYDDGYVWAYFASSAEAIEKLDISRSHISQVLSGKRNRTGIYTFEFVAVAEPAINDRVLVNAKEDTFLTINGRLLQRKTLNNGNQMWVEFTLTPKSRGYISVTTAYAPLPGRQQLHRLVHRAFTPQSKIDAKIAKTRARNAEIEALLANKNLSKGVRAQLESERNGLEYADFEIDHVDGNPLNNSLDNLEMRTKHEHRVKTRGQPIIETETTDRNSRVIATFSSMTDAAASANMPNMSFWRQFYEGAASIEYNDGTTRHFHKK